MVKVRHVLPFVFVALVSPLSAQAPTKAQVDALLKKAAADVAATLKKAQADVDALYVTPATATSIAVNAGGDFQAALNKARPGDTILLQAGATFTGNFVMPVKTGSSYITIRSSASDDVLPVIGVRISPTDAPNLPKLQSPNNLPALSTAPGAHHFALVCLEVLPNRQPSGDMLDLGDGDRHVQTTLASVPHHLTVDRVYLHGDPTNGQKRAIGLNSASTEIVNSYIAEIKSSGEDSQAIAGWNGPGPFTIRNNYLEAASENVLFGGSDPGIPNLIPSDISITANTITKPLAWRTQSWNVKNLLELKNAQRVVIDGNVIENVWGAAQTGYAMLLTPRNQDGHCAWCAVADVVISHNAFRHMASWLQIAGTDDTNPSGRTARVQVLNNIVEDVDPWESTGWGGEDKLIAIFDGPSDVTIDANQITGRHLGEQVYFSRRDGQPLCVRLKVTVNTWPPAEYSIFGADSVDGKAADGLPVAWHDFVDVGTSVLSGNVER